MERYEAYKGSGVEWIGEIPEGWSISRVKWLASTRRGNGIQRGDVVEEGLPCVRYGELYTTYGNSICEIVSHIQPELWARSVRISPGDMVMALTGETKEDIGPTAVNLSGEEVAISGDSLALRPEGAITGRFASYAINSPYVASQKYLSAHGEIIVHLGADEVRELLVVLPSLREQERIADYLDAKVAEVDALVADCEREVGLLREYRKAVISEAVTKGLDAHAPMRDSGVEWIGEIPEGWLVRPSKTLFAESKELRHISDEQCTASQKYGIIPQEQYIALENQRMVAADKNLDAWKHVEPGDFVISLRSFQGGLELSSITGCVTWHYIVLKGSPSVESSYYKYMFKTQKYIESLQRTCSYIRDGQDLRYSNFVQVPLPLPPREEQVEIGIYLDAKTAEIDSLIEAKQSMADKLREYRKSLISEAVTGKFRVPSDWGREGEGSHD